MKLTGKPDRRIRMSGDVPPSAYSVSSRRRGYISAKPVGGFVPKLTRKAFEKHGFSSVTLISDWATIVGAELAAYTAPERLKWPRGVEIYEDTSADQRGRPGATLILGVEAARALDVEYSAQQIIERVNAYFGYAAIAAIKILQRQTLAPVSEAGPRPPSFRRPMTTESERPTSATDTELGAIQDEGLREALAKLALNLRAEAAQG
jgi:hypothetical protein